MTSPAKPIATPAEIEHALHERERAEEALTVALERWTRNNERYLALLADAACGERAP